MEALKQKKCEGWQLAVFLCYQQFFFFKKYQILCFLILYAKQNEVETWKQGQGLNCLGGEHLSTEHVNNIKDVGTKQVGSGSMSTIDHEFMDAGRGC